jgi:hypothetical protein
VSDDRPVIDKVMRTLMLSTDAGEVIAARGRVLALRGCDGHKFVDEYMNGGKPSNGRMYSEAEVREIQKKAIEAGRQIERVARSRAPDDEADWFERVQHCLKHINRFESRHHEFIEDMAERLRFRAFESFSDKQQKYLHDLWMRARRWP